MSIIKVIFELLVLYLVYKLIFDFIIPVYKTTKQVSQKMNDMQTRMNEQIKQQQNNTNTAAPKENTAKATKEDYIEFEEVK